jgi:enoyl-CoA hydratase
LLYELNDAFDLAAQDDTVKVIILAANGPHFSAGHDLREQNSYQKMSEFRTVGTWCGFTCAGAEAQMAREKEIYVGFSERWRNVPKPTIAAVQGRCIAGGLMLIWPCDIIIASEDAQFSDPVVSFGIGGVEFFQHAWEVGVRKAKEMLFTSDFLSAEEAKQLGMVNQIVPKEKLQDAALNGSEDHQEVTLCTQTDQRSRKCRPRRTGPPTSHANVFRSAPACPHPLAQVVQFVT